MTRSEVMVLSEESKRMLDGLMVVRETLAPDLTPGELQLFAMVASRSGLDPFARQIYAVKRSGRMTIQTGIDGYRSIAARTGLYDGQDEPTFGPQCGCARGTAHPESATVRVYRKGVGRPIAATVYWHEYVPEKDDFMWRRMPHVMIGKVAEAAALRKAFPWDPSSGVGIGSDVYTAEEMAQADNAAPPVPRVSVQDRVAARAEALAEVGEMATPFGVSLRVFADSVRGMDPSAVLAARQALFPEARSVKALSDEQRAALLDRLSSVPPEAQGSTETPETESSGTSIEGEYTQIDDEGRILNPEEVAEGAKVIREHPDPEAVAVCGEASPFTEGATCILPAEHPSGFHRSGPKEAWPR